MADLFQKINFDEACACQKEVGEIRDRLTSIAKRVDGLHLDGAYDAIDDALASLSAASDAITEKLDSARGEAA